MIDQAQTDRFKEIFDLGKNILVIFPETKDLDLLIASYCLHLFLIEKGSSLLTPKFTIKLPDELKELIDNKKIATELGKENLLVSFPYSEDQVDNVSYYIGENDKRFYLTIKPKKGTNPLDGSLVEFSYIGTSADVVIVLGVDDLEKLNQLYFGYENLYKNTNTNIVSINNATVDFAGLNLNVSPNVSYCEAIYRLVRKLEHSEEEFFTQNNIATLLLYGIEYKSRGLQSFDVDAKTFFTVAELLNFGAKRLFSLDLKKGYKSKTPKKKIIAQNQIHLIK